MVRDRSGGTGRQCDSSPAGPDTKVLRSFFKSGSRVVRTVAPDPAGLRAKGIDGYNAGDEDKLPPQGGPARLSCGDPPGFSQLRRGARAHFPIYIREFSFTSFSYCKTVNQSFHHSLPLIDTPICAQIPPISLNDDTSNVINHDQSLVGTQTVFNWGEYIHLVSHIYKGKNFFPTMMDPSRRRTAGIAAESAGAPESSGLV